MTAEEWMSTSSRIFARLFWLERMAQDSGMSESERAEYEALTSEGISLFRHHPPPSRPLRIAGAAGRE